MKLMAVVFALMATAVVAVAATYVLSASQADATEEFRQPVWQMALAFPHDPFEGIAADLDGNASALVASDVA